MYASKLFFLFSCHSTKVGVGLPYKLPHPPPSEVLLVGGCGTYDMKFRLRPPKPNPTVRLKKSPHNIPPHTTHLRSTCSYKTLEHAQRLLGRDIHPRWKAILIFFERIQFSHTKGGKSVIFFINMWTAKAAKNRGRRRIMARKKSPIFLFITIHAGNVQQMYMARRRRRCRDV